MPQMNDFSASEPAGRALEPTGRGLKPSEGPRSQVGGLQSQLGGRGEGGRRRNRKKRITERFPICGGTIGHRPLRGRCPKTGVLENREKTISEREKND